MSPALACVCLCAHLLILKFYYPRMQTAMNKAKKDMERAAVAAGCWDPKEIQNSAKNWDKTAIARLVAVNYKYGYPKDESDWDVWVEGMLVEI